MGNSKIKRLLWITSTLHTVGGGERLLLEGVKYYKSVGIDVLVLTWDFKPEALFDGRYSAEGIEVIDGSQDQGHGLVTRALRRLGTLATLRRKIKNFNPDIIFNQSEYDATLLKLSLIGTHYRYVSFVFGQMYQFHEDLQKYAFPYRKHLKEIRNSTPGYRQMVPLERPSAKLKDIVLAQLIAIPRYFAMRSSLALLVFSKQVQWEVSKVYDAKADIHKGAFPLSALQSKQTYKTANLRSKPNEILLLSLSRLIPKKRVDLKIEAMAILVHTRSHQDIRLVIGGKGAEKDNLLKLIEDLNLSSYVTYLGYVPEVDVLPLTSECDVFLSLDVADFDISPYLALAAKRKVIWSSEMDMDDYLSNCGAVFPTEPTAEDLANAIESALATKATKIDWSGREKYTWETYFGNIKELVERRIGTDSRET